MISCHALTPKEPTDAWYDARRKNKLISNQQNMEKLKNQTISISVSKHGAELTSIKKGDIEYLWQADPTFWGRHSPVLFPIVGSLWEGRYRVGEKQYLIGQHGFARDMDFTLLSHTNDSISYRLDSDLQTMESFPWPFALTISYRLRDNEIDVSWEVENKGDETMYFQIGAHPAFNYPYYDPNSRARGYFSFDRSEGLECIKITEKGCVDTNARYYLETRADGLYPLESDTFDSIDTLMLQDGQLHRVTLHAPDGNPWLSVLFDAPVVGLWSPPYKNAPFVCIEPWYGRCDRVGYSGQFSERDWINSLAPGKIFKASYKIIID